MTSVIIRGYPFEDQDTTETQYGRIMGALQEPGVDGNPGGPDLSAFLPGGMFVRVQPGRALVRGFVAEQDTPAGVDVPVEPAESQARVDRLVARVNPVTNTSTLEVLKGTRGSLVPPAITRSETGAYDVKLWRFTVGALAPEPTNLVDEREWVSHRVQNWTTSTRPTGDDLRRGTVGVNHTTGRVEWNPTGRDGDWSYFLEPRDQPVRTPWTLVPLAGGFAHYSGGGQPPTVHNHEGLRYCTDGAQVWLAGAVTYLSGGLAPAGSLIGVLPENLRSTMRVDTLTAQGAQVSISPVTGDIVLATANVTPFAIVVTSWLRV